MTLSKVYLDHNASAPLLAEARDAMQNAMAMQGNPSSVHGHGRALQSLIEDARKSVSNLAGAKTEQVVFTGSATEAITQAIVGGVRNFRIDRVLLSAGEHAAVASAAQSCGAAVESIGLLKNGEIDLGALALALAVADDKGEKVLVAMHWVNNETGVVQPIGEIGALVGPTPHILFVDGVQAFGKLTMAFSSSPIDMMAVTAHKIGGPAGVGALLVKSHCDQVRLIPGGGQEQGRRGGTQSATLIAGFGAATQSYATHFDLEKLSGQMCDFEAKVKNMCPDVAIFGAEADRIGTVSNFALPGLSNTVLMMGLDLSGISVSAGSACSSGKVSASHVLRAMGVLDKMALNAIRVSAGWTSQKQDFERTLAAMTNIFNRQVSRNGQAA